jgi:hypothetical protein
MRNLLKILLGPAILFGLSVPVAFSFQPTGKTYVENYIGSIPKVKLSEREIKDLLHMREEEKLARDVYLTLYNYWRLPIFKNIARSESWHMHMVGLLLKKYNLPDPVEETGDRIGVFKDKHLQELYNKLVAQGKRSLINALKVGATIEDLDIYDLQRAIKDTDKPDIKTVYENLMKGSRNHMRAFVRLLRRYGADYSPQYISRAEFERIVSTPIERGFVKAQGTNAQNQPQRWTQNGNILSGKVLKLQKERKGKDG